MIIKIISLFGVTTDMSKKVANLLFQPVRVYQNVNYEGQYGYLNRFGTFEGTSKPIYGKNLFKENDISSLKIPPGWGVTLYAANRNDSITFNNGNSNTYMNIPSLVDHGFNDKTVAINVHRAPEGFAAVEHFDYDFAKCQNKIIYVILAIMTVILIWLYIKVYWNPKHSTGFAPTNMTGRW